MCEHAVHSDSVAANKINDRLKDLHKALFLESNPIPVKWGIHRLGLIEAGIRLPMTWLSEQYEADLEAVMQAAGVL